MEEQQKESNLHQPNFGWVGPNPVFCQTCMFVEVREPFGRLPKVAHCKIYEAPEMKPEEVYLKGEPCEYYEKDKRKFEK
ncbi:hypothetical protein AALB19_10590 [Oscillospiraceae bacterium 50-58]|jgi:hypothetical protein